MTDVVRSVIVRVRGDVSGLEGAYKRGGTATDDFANKLERAGENSKLVSEHQKELGTRLRENNRELTSYNKNLDKMGSSTSSSSSKVRKLSGDTEQLDRRTKSLGVTTTKTSNQIDRQSGRLMLAAQAALAFGPGLVAGAIVPLAGLVGQATAAGIGLGVLIGSFQGVKGAVTALAKADLDPTVENLRAADIAMEGLSPAARRMAVDIQTRAVPALKALRNEGSQAMFPGLIAGADALGSRLPETKALVHGVAAEIGDLGRDAGKALSGPAWDKAFNYAIATTPGLLDDIGRSLGNLALAGVNTIAALDPLTQDWSGGLLDFTQKLADGSANLEDNKGFQDFLAYAQQVGPEVTHSLGQILEMFISIGKAGAPLSGPLIKTLGDVAEIVGKIADSDFGTPLVAGVLAMTAYTKATSLAAAAQKKLGLATATGGIGRGGFLGDMKKAQLSVRGLGADLLAVGKNSRSPQSIFSVGKDGTAQRISAVTRESERLKSSLKTVGKGAAVLGGVAVLASGAADGIGLTNTAAGALAGTMLGPWGTAIGASAGLLLDAKDAASGFGDMLDRVNAAAKNNDLIAATAQLDKLKAANADLNKTSGVGDFFSDVGKSYGGSLFRLLGATNLTMHSLTKAEDVVGNLKGSLADRSAAANLALLGAGFITTAHGSDVATMSVQAFQSSLVSLNNTLSGRADRVNYEASLDDFRTALDQAKKDVAKSGKKLIVNGKINIDIPAGRSARTALDNIAGSALKVAANLKGVNRVKFMANARGEFLQAAQAMGIPLKAARRLANELLGLNVAKPNPKVNLNTAAAEAKRKALQQSLRQLDNTTAKPKVALKDNATPWIDRIRNALLGLHDRTITIHTVHNDSYQSKRAGQPLPGRPSAYGNFFPATRSYAFGDVINGHQPEMAGPGPTRIWREPETQGESYIPHANDSRRPRAKAITEQTANLMGGQVTWNAAGSITPSGTSTLHVGGYTIIVPDAKTLKYAQGLAAAAAEAAAAGLVQAKTAKELRADRVSELNTQQQIRDINRDLDKMEGKKGHRHLALRGLDRKAAKAELASAKDDLADIRNSAADAVTQAKKDAAEALAATRKDTITTLSGAGDIFARGNGAQSAVSSVNAAVRDIGQYGQVVAQLKAAGASPALLGQVVAKAEGGDFRSAIRLGQALLAQPATLKQLNASLASLATVSGSVASVTTDPRFLSSAAWNPTGVAPRLVNVALTADPSKMMSELTRLITFAVKTELQAVT